MSEEFVCLFNFTENHHVIETFFDNLSLRVKVVILDNIDPNSDYFITDIKSRINSIPNMIFLCVTSSKISLEVRSEQYDYRKVSTIGRGLFQIFFSQPWLIFEVGLFQIFFTILAYF